MRRKTLLAACLLLVAGAVVMSTTGCRRVALETIDPSSNLQKTVQLEGAQALAVKVEQGVGTLRLESGAASGTAMSGDFKSQPVDWTPTISYSVEGTTGSLSVAQQNPDKGVHFGNNRNDWVMRLAGGVPIALDVQLGAGESKLNLGDLDVRRLDVMVGAGESTVDLVGRRTNDLDARIEGGVGALKLLVPNDVGVEVVGGNDGIGDFSAPGLHQVGENRFVNDAFGKSPVSMRIHLTHGVGEVRVESAPF